MNRSNLFNLENEIIIVTGVSGQLGIQYTKKFLENGACVIGVDTHKSQSVKELEPLFSNTFLFLVADVTLKESLESVLGVVKSKFGVPTVLVNNAAIDSPPSAPISETGPFEYYPESSWDKVLGVNLKGVFLCCQIFGSAMAKNGRGSIVNISSIYGMVSPDQSLYEYRRKRGETFFKPVAYSASKSGVLNLTRYLAVYWAKSGVRVNSLSIAGVFNNQDGEFIDSYCSRIPIGRMASPEDYFGALIYLASNASLYMTGHNLVVDGGWTSI